MNFSQDVIDKVAIVAQWIYNRLYRVGNPVVSFQYTNHRGERSTRRVLPLNFYYGNPRTDYHNDEGWYLDAIDLDKTALRTFAVKDMEIEG